MNKSQSIGYLETVANAGIAPRNCSRSMFRLLRTAARIARRAGAAEDSYFGLEKKSPVSAWLFRMPVWSDIDPRSTKLQSAIEARFPIADPNADVWSLAGY